MPLLSTLGLKLSPISVPGEQPLSWLLVDGIGGAGYASTADDTDGNVYVVSYGSAARLNEYGNQVWANSYSGLQNMYNVAIDENRVYCIGGKAFSSDIELLILDKSDGSVIYAGEVVGLKGDRAVAINTADDILYLGGIGTTNDPVIASLDISSSTPSINGAVTISSIDRTGDFSVYDMAYNPQIGEVHVSASTDFGTQGVIFFSVDEDTLNTQDGVSILPASSQNMFYPLVSYNPTYSSIVGFSFTCLESGRGLEQVWGAYDGLDQVFSSLTPSFIRRNAILPTYTTSFNGIATTQTGEFLLLSGKNYLGTVNTTNGADSAVSSFGTNPLYSDLFAISATPGGIITGNGRDVIKLNSFYDPAVGYVNNNPSQGTFYDSSNGSINSQSIPGDFNIDDNMSITDQSYSVSLSTLSVTATPYQITSLKYAIVTP